MAALRATSTPWSRATFPLRISISSLAWAMTNLVLMQPRLCVFTGSTSRTPDTSPPFLGCMYHAKAQNHAHASPLRPSRCVSTQPPALWVDNNGKMERYRSIGRDETRVRGHATQRTLFAPHLCCSRHCVAATRPICDLLCTPHDWTVCSHRPTPSEYPAPSTNHLSKRPQPRMVEWAKSGLPPPHSLGPSIPTRAHLRFALLTRCLCLLGCEAETIQGPDAPPPGRLQDPCAHK